MKQILIIIIMIMILVGTTYVVLQHQIKKCKVLAVEQTIEKEKIRKRMKYHGTLYVFRGKDGKFYFYRKGKKCLLW